MCSAIASPFLSCSYRTRRSRVNTGSHAGPPRSPSTRTRFMGACNSVRFGKPNRQSACKWLPLERQRHDLLDRCLSSHSSRRPGDQGTPAPDALWRPRRLADRRARSASLMRRSRWARLRMATPLMLWSACCPGALVALATHLPGGSSGAALLLGGSLSHMIDTSGADASAITCACASGRHSIWPTPRSRSAPSASSSPLAIFLAILT